MRITNLRSLPKLRDSWSYLYIERCRVDCDHKAVAMHDARGKTPIPCANLTLLMLGPGVNITHAAVMTLADHGCLLAWCGEQGVRYYAHGMGETRSAKHTLRQAQLWANEGSRTAVVRQMYALRFDEQLKDDLDIRQIRGMEGVRVREAYARFSRESGVPWTGRNYKRDDWRSADPINRALSSANACLYGLCHAAIVSCGYSPAIGFIHTGHMRAFVYDMADLYKTQTSIPAAFYAVAESPGDNLERRVRMTCRDAFARAKLLERVVPDLQSLMAASPEDEDAEDINADDSGHLWAPDGQSVQARRNYDPSLPANEG